MGMHASMHSAATSASTPAPVTPPSPASETVAAGGSLADVTFGAFTDTGSRIDSYSLTKTNVLGSATVSGSGLGPYAISGEASREVLMLELDALDADSNILATAVYVGYVGTAGVWRTLALNTPDATQAGSDGHGVSNVTATTLDIDDSATNASPSSSELQGRSWDLVDVNGDALLFQDLFSLVVVVDWSPTGTDDVDLRAHLAVTDGEFGAVAEGMAFQKADAVDERIGLGRVHNNVAPSTSLENNSSGRARLDMTFEDSNTADSRKLNVAAIRGFLSAGNDGMNAVSNQFPGKNFTDSNQVRLALYVGRLAGTGTDTLGATIQYLAITEPS